MPIAVRQNFKMVEKLRYSAIIRTYRKTLKLGTIAMHVNKTEKNIFIIFFVQGAKIRHTAIADMPSSLPIIPIRSEVVAFTETASGSTPRSSAIFVLMRSM